jgi:hypothetical protein
MNKIMLFWNVVVLFVCLEAKLGSCDDICQSKDEKVGQFFGSLPNFQAEQGKPLYRGSESTTCAVVNLVKNWLFAELVNICTRCTILYHLF